MKSASKSSLTPAVGLVLILLATTAISRVSSGPSGTAKQAHPSKNAGKDVADTALADPNLSTWARAVKQSGRDSTLHQTPSTFILFVPTDAAFAKLPSAALKKLFDNSIEGQQAVTELVMRHAVMGSTFTPPT